jgi:glutamine cyclotransferase
MKHKNKLFMFPNPERMGGWDILQQLLEKIGNPRYGIRGDLDLRNSPIESLGNLEYVGGNLNLNDTPIKSLGNLEYVGGNLYLYNTPIESLGNLEYVGGNLILKGTPLSLFRTSGRIRSKINVIGYIYFE